MLGDYLSNKSLSTPIALKGFFTDRQKQQKDNYGFQSGIPGYEIPIQLHPDSDLEKFRVAIVQTLMPYLKDISVTHPTEWTPDYRARHRAHLSATCRLIAQKLKVGLIAHGKHRNKTDNKIDLIVFPELSVHPDDLDLLERLSDVTKSIIFAGLTFIKHQHTGKPVNKAVWIVRHKHGKARQLQRIYQGKKFPMREEQKMGVVGHRPYQVILSLRDKARKTSRLTGSICFDATDLNFVSDFREKTDAYVVTALNKDINTFDNMAAALQFHMFQHVVIANCGEFGGSTAQAPYKEPFERQIAHVHGNHQAAVSIFEIDLMAFKDTAPARAKKEIKSPPAGFNGR